MNSSFELEIPLLRAFNWLVRTDPAEEVRLEASRPDQLWWDIWGYGDIPSRQVEAFLFLRKMTGLAAASETEQARRKHLFSTVREDGLSYRPGSTKILAGADMFSQGRHLRCLASLYEEDPNSEEIRRRIQAAIRGLRGIAIQEGQARYFPTHLWDGREWSRLYLFGGRKIEGEVSQTGAGDLTGQLLAPLVDIYELSGDESALELAKELALGLLIPRRTMFQEDGSIPRRHSHNVLNTLVGLLRLGRAAKQNDWVSLARKGFTWFRKDIATGFGFVPEYAVPGSFCETCATVDYLELAIHIGLNGDPGAWEVAERAARNHLVESQCPDGGFASYSLPNELGSPQSPVMLKIFGTLSGPCCSAHGIVGLYLVWKYAVTSDRQKVRVNLLVDRDSGNVQVKSSLPREGKLEISCRQDCELSVRIPSWVPPGRLEARGETGPLPATVKNGFLELGPVAAGKTVTVLFPVHEEKESLQLPFPQAAQNYEISWRGDTVVQVTPEGNSFPVDGRCYPLYQRTLRK